MVTLYALLARQMNGRRGTTHSIAVVATTAAAAVSVPLAPISAAPELLHQSRSKGLDNGRIPTGAGSAFYAARAMLKSAAKRIRMDFITVWLDGVVALLEVPFPR